jgi:hypothetical protein
MLVPSDPAWRGDARLHTGEGWATWVSGRAGATLDLTVSVQARLVGGVGAHTGDRRIRGLDARVTQNEGIWSVAWREHGAAYSMELLCDQPFVGLCRDDTAVVALTESLVFVGGKGMKFVSGPSSEAHR